MSQFQLNLQAQQYLKLAHDAVGRENEGAAADAYRSAIKATNDVQGLVAIASDMDKQLDRQVEAGWNSNVPWRLSPDRLTVTNEALSKAVDLAKNQADVKQIISEAKEDEAFDAGRAALAKLPTVPDTPVDTRAPRYDSFVYQSWNHNDQWHYTDNKTQLSPQAQAYVKMAHSALESGQDPQAANLYRSAVGEANTSRELVAIADDIENASGRSSSWAADQADRLAVTDEALNKAVGLAKSRPELDEVFAAAGNDEGFNAGRSAVEKLSSFPAEAPKRQWWNPSTWS